MEQRYSIVTLGTADISRARQFYEDVLGWSPFMTEGMTAYDAGGFVLGLFPHEELARDSGLEPRTIEEGYRGYALAFNARSEAEVDTLLAHIDDHGTVLGAKILRPAHKAFWGGYSGYFADPDGHAWEIAFNPYWPLSAEGKLQLPPAEQAPDPVR